MKWSSKTRNMHPNVVFKTCNTIHTLLCVTHDGKTKRKRYSIYDNYLSEYIPRVFKLLETIIWIKNNNRDIIYVALIRPSLVQ